MLILCKAQAYRRSLQQEDAFRFPPSHFILFLSVKEEEKMRDLKKVGPFLANASWFGGQNELGFAVRQIKHP